MKLISVTVEMPIAAFVYGMRYKNAAYGFSRRRKSKNDRYESDHETPDTERFKTRYQIGPCLDKGRGRSRGKGLTLQSKRCSCYGDIAARAKALRRADTIH